MATLAIAAAGTAAGGVAGGLVGGPPGAVLGAQAGFLGGRVLGGILSPPDSGLQKPNTDDIRVTSSAIGRPIPVPNGTQQIAGQYIWASKVRAKKRTVSVGTGYSTGTTIWKLFGDFALSLGEGPIGGVPRIWANNDLIFDISDGNVGPALHAAFIEAAAAFPDELTLTDTEAIELEGLDFGRVRIYLGSETQLPDPLIQQDERIADALGLSDPADAVSAFRGLAYVVFQDFPFQITGNAFGQFLFEVAETVTPAFPATTVTGGPMDHDRLAWGPDLDTLHSDPRLGGTIYRASSLGKTSDNPTAVPLALEAAGEEPMAHVGPFVDGDNIYTEALNLGRQIRRYSRTTGGKTLGPSVGVGSALDPLHAVEYPNGFAPESVLVNQTGGELHVFRARDLAVWASMDYAAIMGFGEWSAAPPKVVDGAVWYGWQPSVAATDSTVARLLEIAPLSGGLVAQHSIVTASPPASDDFADGFGHIAYDALTHSLLLETGGKLRRFSLTDQAVDGEVTYGGALAADNNAAMRMGPWEGKLWLQTGLGDGIAEIDTVAMKVVRTITPSSDFSISISNNTPLYDPRQHAVILAGDDTYWIFLDRIAGAATTLKAIADKACDKCNIAAGERNTTPLAAVPVVGAPWGQRLTGRKALEPHAPAFDMDVRLSGFLLDFFLHGGASVRTIPEDQLGAAASGDGSARAPILVETRDGELTLPQQVDVIALDRLTDYAPTVPQPARRASELVETRDVLTVELPIVFDGPDQPARIAQRLLAQAWARRWKITAFVPHPQIAVEPGDVVTPTVDGVGRDMLVERRTLGANMVIELEGVSEDPEASLSTVTGATWAGFTPQAIGGVPTSQLFLLDSVLLRDRDVGLVRFAAVAPATEVGWSGAEIQESTDGGVSFPTVVDVFGPDEAADWGITLTALPDHSTVCIDETASFDVRMRRGVLTSTTRSGILNLANPLLVGPCEGPFELIQFRDVTSLGGDDYRLGGILGGRRGSDTLAAGHGAGELVLVPSEAWLHRLAAESGEIGQAKVFAAVTLGSLVETSNRKSQTFRGNSLKPYPPSRVKATGGGAADLVGSFNLRTITGGKWRDRVDVQHYESSLEVELDVLDEAGAVVRTITKTASAAGSLVDVAGRSFTYKVADFQADFPLGGPFGRHVFDLVVVQIGATVGRGWERTTRVDTTPNPLTANAHLANVKFLSRFDRDPPIDQSPSGHSITNGGTITAGASVFPGRAALDLAALQQATAPDHADFTLAALEHTIAFWMFLRGTGGGQNWVNHHKNPGARGWSIAGTPTAVSYSYSTDGSNNFVTNRTFPASIAGRWSHHALTRDSSDDWRYFLDGAQQGAAVALAGASFFDNGEPLRIGGGAFDGIIAELLIAHTAIWTSDFDPPGAPWAHY
jgi:hypothetical protein